MSLKNLKIGETKVFGALFSLWYKEENSKKWKKSSLQMMNEESLKKNAEKLVKQEGWKETKVLPDGQDPNQKE
jgi:hypothetical protein